jgi:cytochrome P450
MGKLFDSYSSKANTMTYYQLEQNAQLLVFAGTETTMTALSCKD